MGYRQQLNSTKDTISLGDLVFPELLEQHVSVQATAMKHTYR